MQVAYGHLDLGEVASEHLYPGERCDVELVGDHKRLHRLADPSVRSAHTGCRAESRLSHEVEVVRQPLELVSKALLISKVAR